MWVLMESYLPCNIQCSESLSQHQEEAVDHLIGFRIELCEGDEAVVVLVVVLEQGVVVAGIAQTSQGLAEFTVRELAVAILIQALPPRPNHVAKLAAAEDLELLRSVDEAVGLSVLAAAFGELFTVCGVPSTPDLVEEASLVPLLEAHLQRRLPYVALLWLADHAIIATAQRIVGPSVEVLDGHELSAGFWLQDFEECLWITRKAHILASLAERLLIHKTAALQVQALEPGQEHISVLLAKLLAQFRQMQIRLWVQIPEHQIAFFVRAAAQLHPERPDLTVEGQAVKGHAELPEGQPAVAVQVQGLAPGAPERSASHLQGLFEAFRGVKATLHLLDSHPVLFHDLLALLGQAVPRGNDAAVLRGAVGEAAQELLGLGQVFQELCRLLHDHAGMVAGDPLCP
mmetsp:Transcript_34062/g.61275  ORF Transcript_34062/g.61275 Transcript_34062/m.61275 type:complete len:401 (+) Transcript_34062:1488-2690(+)